MSLAPIPRYVRNTRCMRRRCATAYRGLPRLREVRGEWQVVVADMSATIADRDAVIANTVAGNEHLRAQIAELKAKRGG